MSDVEQDETLHNSMTLSGYPIIWNEKTLKMLMGDIVLADWLTYLKLKKKAEEDDPEAT